MQAFWPKAQQNRAWAAIILIASSACVPLAYGQTNAPAQASEANAPTQTINEWLLRMHDAAMRKRSYVGTFVQSSTQGMSSARIWHTCDGVQQIERVETLTGAPRSTFRHNEKLVTFMPEAKVVRIEKRESIGGFPELLKPGAGNIPEFYAVKAQGYERVAGLDADVVQLEPKDALRFGYRIWTEKKSNLVVKIQTLEANGSVLEQSAFSELQLDAPVKMDKLVHMMAATDGYRVDKTEVTKTSAAAEGWAIKTPVPGFKPLTCYKRAPSGGSGESTLQWIFSDGLATVSLFVESFDKTRHTQEGVLAMGATHTLLRRLNDYWLTAVGEVPPQTLKNFALNLERKK
jgi:sigma-E factor negative regulatory protein RseB